MIIDEEKIIVGGSEIVLRCFNEDDAEIYIDGYKKFLEETQFLSFDPDEVNYTSEQIKGMIKNYNSSDKDLFIAAFVDGRYAGCCNLYSVSSARRTAHRAICGIALFQEFSGRGLGTLMLEKLLAEAKKAGYGQIELGTYYENVRARKLYEKLGFKECGRIPDAVRFPDGTSFDEITMYKKL